MLSIGDFARLGNVSPRMLRHYDELGLLRPERVDTATGYRSYSVAQLCRLHRLVALRDLGLCLEQIRDVLNDEPPIEQLRGMLRLRRTQIEQTIADEQARLRRVEAHLHALEQGEAMSTIDVVIKQTQPLRIAEATGTAPGFGHENLEPVFAALLPKVVDRLSQANARLGMSVAYYEEPSYEGELVVHAGFEIHDQAVADDELIRVVELPVVEVASVVHRGPMNDIVGTYESLVRWIEASGYKLNGRSRELYLEWHDDKPERNVTELQMPIAR